ncbi:pleckstrin homology domain-containing family M member 1 [Diorhabda sublineata]|uniref:pleckstrin homology domain-containing family M member 1 n=1 Tax=Diorhabda sublineata TaxID=1163346 RepID=UPI0024E173D2|nr:pleckstrin homology domain-containing family M member 1 [Diorhabda sublineata]
MNKLIKSVRSVTNNKDDIIKKSIINQLSNSCKEIHYAGAEENKSPKSSEYLVTEAANTLCTTIEAIFLHGLRDTLTHRFKKVLADVDEQPEPSFWAPLLIISHRQIIDQITNLSQITTEVGQCRVWIRLALNDCLLSSYLMSIRQDSSSLKSYYRVNSFLRDSELLDVAQRLIEGVEAFKNFTLPFNSSLLNTWPLPSLVLAGIWAPTLKSCPVAPCDDVVQSITISESMKSQANFECSSDTVSMCSVRSNNSQNSGLRPIVFLPEDEVLKIILADGDKTASNSQSFEDLKSDCSSDQEKNYDVENINNIGNSLGKRTGWSFDESQLSETSKNEKLNDKDIEPIQDDPKSMETSFTDLINSYNPFIKTPDIREVLMKFEDKRKEIPKGIKVESENPALTLSSPVKREICLAAQVGKIAREKGLDAHNYKCADCGAPLELNNKPKVCAFTGDYVCDMCMSTELVQIPARIIHNWDFKAYPISKKGINYLNEVKDHPIIDFKVLNPFIYSVVEEMANLQILRNQLNFLRAYLFTCREPVIEELQKQMWPREYMYEHIHQYSILDLSDVMNGLLAQQLEKVVAFGRDHVYNCWLCNQKGFVCEICNKPKALFPFDVENVFRCDICNAVYHKSCWNPSVQCRKCKRKMDREELPLLDATVIE